MTHGLHACDRDILRQMVEEIENPPPTPKSPPEHVITLVPGVRLRFQKASWVNAEVGCALEDFLAMARDKHQVAPDAPLKVDIAALLALLPERAPEEHWAASL